jgi:hypothetical protein
MKRPELKPQSRASREHEFDADIVEPLEMQIAISPNAAPVKVGAVATLPLFVVLRQEWADPATLAEEVVRNPSLPIRKGARLVIAEVLPSEGIRFHDVRRRSDDRVTVGGADVIDRAAFDEAERREVAERQATMALARAERETLSTRSPVWTTD